MANRDAYIAVVNKALQDVLSAVEKAPPGPPPRPGLEWKEETHRWIRPDEMVIEEPASDAFMEAVDMLITGEDVRILTGSQEGKFGTIDTITEDPNHGVLVDIDGEKGWIDPTNLIPVMKQPDGSFIPTHDYQDDMYYDYFPEDYDKPIKEVFNDALRAMKNFYPKKDSSYKDASEFGALQMYQNGDMDSDNLRKGQGLSSFETQLVKELVSLMSPTSQKQKVFRGITGDLNDVSGDMYSEGDVVTIDAFTSTSRNPFTATSFMGIYNKVSENKTAVFMEIDIPEGVHAITLDNEDSDEYKEDETILNIGQQFEITSVEHDKDMSSVARFRGVGKDRDVKVTYMKLAAVPTGSSSSNLDENGKYKAGTDVRLTGGLQNGLSGKVVRYEEGGYLVELEGGYIRWANEEWVLPSLGGKQSKSLERAYRAIYAALNVISKAPPGPKPKHFGEHIIWDEDKRRWVDPTKDGELAGKQVDEEWLDAISSLNVGDVVGITEGDKEGQFGTIVQISDDPNYGVLVDIDGEKGWVDVEHTDSDAGLPSDAEDGEKADSPKLEVGAKVDIQLNNWPSPKSGKVVHVDENGAYSTVTIDEYGDTEYRINIDDLTVTEPSLLDEGNPNVPDTWTQAAHQGAKVRVTGGEYAGKEGRVDYVPSYLDDDLEVRFDEGGVFYVGRDELELIPSPPVEYGEGDRVQFDFEGEEISGKVLSVDGETVSIDADGEVVEVPKDSLSKYFESGDKVVIIDGEYKDEAGVVMSDSGDSYRVSTMYGVHYKVADELEMVEARPDSLKRYSPKDRVEVVEGKDEGKVGTVYDVASQGWIQSVKVRFDDGSKGIFRNAELAESDTLKPESKVKTGQGIKVVEGPYEGYEGFVTNIFENYSGDTILNVVTPTTQFSVMDTLVVGHDVPFEPQPRPYSDPPVFNLEDTVQINHGQYFGKIAIVSDISLGADEVKINLLDGRDAVIPKEYLTQVQPNGFGGWTEKVPKWDYDKVVEDMPDGTWVEVGSDVDGVHNARGEIARVATDGVLDGSGVQVEFYSNGTVTSGIVEDPNKLTVVQKNEYDSPAPSPIDEDQLLNTEDVEYPNVGGFYVGDTVGYKGGRKGVIRQINSNGTVLLEDKVTGEQTWVSPYQQGFYKMGSSPEIVVAQYDNERRRKLREKVRREAKALEYERLKESGGTLGVQTFRGNEGTYSASMWRNDIEAYLDVYDPEEEPAYRNVGEYEGLDWYTQDGHKELNKRLREGIPLEGEIPEPDVWEVEQKVSELLEEMDIDQDDESYDYYYEELTDQVHNELQEQLLEADYDDEFGDLTDKYYSIKSSMSELGSSQILYRGMEMPPMSDSGGLAKEGDEATLLGFSSASRDPTIASGFAGGETVFEIEVDPQVRAVVMANRDTHHNEHETLIDEGVKFIYDIVERGYTMPDGKRLDHYVKGRLVPV